MVAAGLRLPGSGLGRPAHCNTVGWVRGSSGRMAESPARGTSTPVKLFITQFYPDNVAEADVDAVLRAIPVRQWAAHCAARHALTTGHYGGGGSKSRPTGQGGFGTRRIVWYAAPVARDQATTASARSAALALTPDPRIADQRCVIGHSLARYSLLSCGARKPLVIRRGESGKPHLERVRVATGAAARAVASPLSVEVPPFAASAVH